LFGFTFFGIFIALFRILPRLIIAIRRIFLILIDYTKQKLFFIGLVSKNAKNCAKKCQIMIKMGATCEIENPLVAV